MSGDKDYRDRIASALNGRRKPLSDPSATAAFAGERAATANADALDLAKRMHAAGSSRDEIWAATRDKHGQPWWFDEGRWNFETGGDTPTLKPEFEQFARQGGTRRLRDVYDDEATYEAYPRLGGTAITTANPERFKPNDVGAYVRDPGNRTMSPVHIVERKRMDVLPRYLAHERQHLIDNYEQKGPRGPDAELWEDRRREKRADNAAMRDTHMTPEQKMRLPPWETEDVSMADRATLYAEPPRSLKAQQMLMGRMYK